MRRMATIFLALLLGSLLAACNVGEQEEVETPTATTLALEKSEITTSIGIYPPDEIKIVPDEIIEMFGEFDFMPTKRQIYYEISWPFDDLGNIEEMYTYLGPIPPGEEPKEMVYLSLVKYFNIPKEDFEKANEELRRSRLSFGDNLTLEDNELPNADIIYTFDNEIINAYYRRENPVVPEPGTYTTYESYEEYLKANR